MSVLRSVSFDQYVRLALSHEKIYQNNDGSWTIEIPVLPGCITWGKTRAEAVIMAKDAIEAWIMAALRFGDPIPEIDDCVLQHTWDEVSEATIDE